MKKKNQMPEFFINAFYESKFRNNLFVIKAGGKIIEDDKMLENLLANIRDLNMRGIKTLLVYGGGNAMDIESAKRGVQVTKHEGRRITDQASIDVMKHVVGGDLALKISSFMARLNLEGYAFNAVPPAWMDVDLRDKKPVDFGFVGEIKRVHVRPINRLMKNTNFVVTSCLSFTEKGEICNINADTIATQIAIRLQAHKLIFLSDVDGVKINGKTTDLITTTQIDGYIADGTVDGGMRVKLENCKAALLAGVRRIHLLNGFRDDALHKEIFEPVGTGTMLIMDDERGAYENEIEAQKAVEGYK